MAHDKIIPFVWAGAPYNEEAHWVDLNGDGRSDEAEIFFVSESGSWEQNARATLPKETSSSPAFESWQIQRFASKQEYFSHPEKSTFELQLIIDIGRLDRMPNRPGIYSELLQDLRSIQDELQYTRFRYAEEGELPEGVLAQYEPSTSTMTTRRNPPTAVLVHELDHALSAHRRTSRSILETHPSVDPSAITGFKFYLDYPLKKNADDEGVSLYFDALAFYEPYLASPDPQHPLCLTEANLQAHLANEVHAFQSMARYWLFQLGVSDADLQKIREGGSAKSDFLESLRSKCHETLNGMNTDPAFAYDVLRYYFDEGGWVYSDLRDLVKSTYTEMKDPGFVDVADCIPRAKRPSGGCNGPF